MKNKRKIIKTLIILLVILLVFGIYSAGRLRGTIEGIALSQIANNKSICVFLNKERDNEGYCILSEDARFTIRKECKWEKFIVIGKVELPYYLKPTEGIRNLIYYPFIGC